MTMRSALKRQPATSVQNGKIQAAVQDDFLSARA